MDRLILYILEAFSIISISISILQKKVFYSIVYLIIFTILIGIMFFNINSNFCAILEIIIYSGGILIIFLFSLMTLNKKEFGEKIEFNKEFFLKIFVSFFSVLSFLYFFLKKKLNEKSILYKNFTIKQISKEFFENYFFFVGIVSIIILSGIIVSFILCKNKKNKKNI
ncbi:NADH-quinone oxidoreductase subunit J family protein [bacterium endosymbiont of Pedicinus badii]|uniref:NADH-quinone oxidoreductase subunit J family protein n=1 Tax=bacterium endosymbiont of Pedicinus badii TaxID=1719126 RepID=UPI0009BAA259|nr:NADH-quinone oxidoreductase subunit J [bacterium endosymbiont of Pedicinus badii]OQM34449.1 hypothetical protein AOQ89_00990 [bacterium endosymbiont of Pedicinus badii]